MLRRLVAEADHTDSTLYQLTAFEHHLQQHLKHHYALQDELAVTQSELKKSRKCQRNLASRLDEREQESENLR